jgi:hypothetical protein
MAKKTNANPLFTAQALLLATLSLGACAQGTGLAPSTSTMDAQVQANKDGTPAADATPLKAFNRFPDIPVPTKASMDMSRTLVFGSGDTWYGQLGQDTGHSSDAMFDFYKQELPGFGWLEVTSVRAPVSVLTYERQKRILSIQIEPASLGGSKVTLTVSPRVGGTPTMN